MAIEQRLLGRADFDVLDPADHDCVAMPLDKLLDRAIDNGEGVGETPGASGELAPHCPLIPRRPLDLPNPEKRSAIAWWRASSRFTQKRRSATMTGHDDELRLTQMRISGGSVDKGTVEVSVSPVLVSPSPTVMTLTPPNRRRMAALNWAGSRLDAAKAGSGNIIGEPQRSKQIAHSVV